MRENNSEFYFLILIFSYTLFLFSVRMNLLSKIKVQNVSHFMNDISESLLDEPKIKLMARLSGSGLVGIEKATLSYEYTKNVTVPVKGKTTNETNESESSSEVSMPIYSHIRG